MSRRRRARPGGTRTMLERHLRCRPRRLAVAGLVGAASLSAWVVGGRAADGLWPGLTVGDVNVGFLGGLVGGAVGVAGLALSAGRLRPSGREPASAADLVMPREPDGLAIPVAPFEELVDRLRARSGEVHGGSVPLVFVRLGGLEEVRRRHGMAVADRIAIATSHRLRAHVRRDDTMIRLLPSEVLILVAGGASEESASVVARRLTGVLSEPVPAVKPRQAKRVTAKVLLVRGRLGDGRFQVSLDGEHLIDAPIPGGALEAGSSGRPGKGRPFPAGTAIEEGRR